MTEIYTSYSQATAEFLLNPTEWSIKDALTDHSTDSIPWTAALFIARRLESVDQAVFIVAHITGQVILAIFHAFTSLYHISTLILKKSYHLAELKISSSKLLDDVVRIVAAIYALVINVFSPSIATHILHDHQIHTTETLLMIQFLIEMKQNCNAIYRRWASVTKGEKDMLDEDKESLEKWNKILDEQWFSIILERRSSDIGKHYYDEAKLAFDQARNRIKVLRQL